MSDGGDRWTYEELEDVYAEHAKSIGLDVFPRPDGERYLEGTERETDVDAAWDGEAVAARGYRYPTRCKKGEYDKDPWFAPSMFGSLPSPGDVKAPIMERATTDLSDDEIELVHVALCLFASKTHNDARAEQAQALIKKLGLPMPPAEVIADLKGLS